MIRCTDPAIACELCCVGVVGHLCARQLLPAHIAAADFLCEQFDSQRWHFDYASVLLCVWCTGCTAGNCCQLCMLQMLWSANYIAS
jgi:hypothetical protein